MAEYNPSKIIKDGNTYNFRDTTKIPLAGSNQISGSLIPSTDNSIDVGSSTKNIKMLYTKGITINGTQFLPSDYVPRSGGAVVTGSALSRVVNNDEFRLDGGTGWNDGASLSLSGKNRTDANGNILLHTTDGTNTSELLLAPNGTFRYLYNGTYKNVAMQEDTIPRSGGAVISGNFFGKNNSTGDLSISGGTSRNDGSRVSVNGINKDNNYAGAITFSTMPVNTSDPTKYMDLFPNGTWTWNGTACQIISDQRLKQQITEIDDKLLDAWEDVTLCQFKYNDAVDQKGKDKARLHTGYVVQQIDNACKKHGVDVSAYGLYCHEEYPEETEEVEVEQADGTKVKERKVIREASEHYSLRYTEALIVECKYLRRCIARLTARIEELEKGNITK